MWWPDLCILLFFLGLHGYIANSVELDSSDHQMYWCSSEGECSLLSGELWCGESTLLLKKHESHQRYIYCAHTINMYLHIYLLQCTVGQCYKCYHCARGELGFLIKGVHQFLADIFKSYTQPNSQFFSSSSLKRPKPRSATWKTYKTLSERSSSVIRACHCRLCWSRSKSWRYCHTHLTGYVLLFWETSCPL